MNLEMRKDHKLRTELDIIAELESNGGQNVLPDNPNETSFGRYRLNTLSLVDASRNGVAVPDKVKEMIGDWDNKSESDRFMLQEELFGWMKKNQLQVDNIAENYYSKVVRGRANGSPAVAIMMWGNPGQTKKDLGAIGLTDKEVGESPDAATQFLDHISTGNNTARGNHARQLRDMLPMIDRAKNTQPTDPSTIPSAPGVQPATTPTTHVPYPSLDIKDPWLQHGHSIAYRNSLRDFDQAFGTNTTQAAMELDSITYQNPQVRRFGNISKQLDQVETTAGPIDTAIELANVPYGIAKAVGDVVHSQLTDGMGLTERLVQGGGVGLPLLVAGLFSRGKFKGRVKETGKGIDMQATPAAEAAAKDHWTREFESAKTVREGATVNLETAQAAGDVEMIKDAKKQLRAAKDREKFASFVLDKDKGENEVSFLKFKKKMFEEQNASPAAMKALDNKISAAENRSAEAMQQLKLPQVKDMDGAVEVYRNAVKSAKIPAEQLDAAADEAIRSGKVSYETILARDLDAAVDPITANAEVKLVQEAHKTLEALRIAYNMNKGDIVISNAFLTAINKYAPVLAKERRSEIRMGQSTETLAGKSNSLRAFETIIEEMDHQNVPSLMHVWSTAKNDLDRMAQLRNLANPGVFKGAALQMITNNLISSPSTAAWNAISMGAMTLSRMNEMRMMGKLAPELFAPNDASVFATAVVNFYGRLIRGDVVAKAAWNKEMQSASLHAANVDPGVALKYNFRNTISMQGPAADSALGKAVNFIGHMINMPTQISANTDAAFRVGLKEGFVAAKTNDLVHQEIQAQLRAGASFTDKQMQQLAFKRKMEIMGDPNATITVDGKAQLIKDIAGEESAVIAMMGKLQTKSARFIESAAGDSILGRMVVPFWHPTLQIAEMSLERAPGVWRMMPHMRADIAAGGAREAAARAKIATGNQTAALFATFAGATYLLDSPDWGFTGSGPANDAQKPSWTGLYRADTIILGGKEFPLSKLGPVGQVMSFTADAMGVVNEMVNLGAGKTAPMDLLAAVVGTWTSLVASELFADDIKDIVAAMVQRDPDAMQRVFERKATMLVPAGPLLKNFAEVMTDARQILQTQIGEIKMVTPVTFWGDPTRYFGTQNPLLTFLGVSERNAPDWERKNAVDQRVRNDGVGLRAPDKYLTQSGVTLELSLEEQMAAKKFFAKANLGGTLLDVLEKAIRVPFYEKLLDGNGEDRENASRFRTGTKQEYLDMVVSARKKATDAWLFTKSPFASELQERFNNTVQSRAFDLKNNPAVTPPDVQRGTATSPFGLGGVQ